MLNVMEFQKHWNSQMNGVLSGMFANAGHPMSPNYARPPGGIREGMCVSQGHPLMDSPLPIHNLSLNPQAFTPPGFRWEFYQTCR